MELARAGFAGPRTVWEGAHGFLHGYARDASIAALAAKVGYRIDPHNPYPDKYTGLVRVTLADGRVLQSASPTCAAATTSR